MLKEDPAKITVHLVQFEKHVPFCMPSAKGTFGNAFFGTWLRRGGRTMIVAVPFGGGASSAFITEIGVRAWPFVQWEWFL